MHTLLLQRTETLASKKHGKPFYKYAYFYEWIVICVQNLLLR